MQDLRSKLCGTWKVFWWRKSIDRQKSGRRRDEKLTSKGGLSEKYRFFHVGSSLLFWIRKNHREEMLTTFPRALFWCGSCPSGWAKIKPWTMWSICGSANGGEAALLTFVTIFDAGGRKHRRWRSNVSHLSPNPFSTSKTSFHFNLGFRVYSTKYGRLFRLTGVKTFLKWNTKVLVSWQW